MEDNVSTSSTQQVGQWTKEQIYAAFQKAQMRYHKYRGRYTDLAKHYKELERENGKMKVFRNLHSFRFPNDTSRNVAVGACGYSG